MNIIRIYFARLYLPTQAFTKQTPFIDKLQTELAKFEPLFSDKKTIEALLRSGQLMTSTLSAAMETLNFSSELDKLSHEKQIKLLACLESLDLDDEIEVIIPDDLPEEILPDCVTFIEFIRNFWNLNRDAMLGIMATADTAVNGIAKNDFSNIFTILLFIYFCASLLTTTISSIDNDANNSNQKN